MQQMKTMFGDKKIKVGQDRHGLFFNNSDVNTMIFTMIKNENYFYRMAKKMTNDAEKAIEKTNSVAVAFNESLNKYLSVQNEIAEQSKKAHGVVRDSAEKLSAGLQRLEKVANFDKLERYVELLERASKAMYALAELEQNGKLEKISNALK